MSTSTCNRFFPIKSFFHTQTSHDNTAVKTNLKCRRITNKCTVGVVKNGVFLSGEVTVQTVTSWNVVALKQVRKTLKRSSGVSFTKTNHSFCFQGRTRKTLMLGSEMEDACVHAEAFVPRPSSFVPRPSSNALVFFLGRPAASLIVDDRQQDPQVEESDDHEAHQNCERFPSTPQFWLSRLIRIETNPWFVLSRTSLP